MLKKKFFDLHDRESHFESFSQNTLNDFFSKQGQTHYFIGKDQLKIAYITFLQPNQDKLIVLVTGRSEGYLNYQEVAFDLFQCGYNLFIYDHRGQGLSERMLDDQQKGHVTHFADYVIDLDQFLTHIVKPEQYTCRYFLAHSMGCTITAIYLLKNQAHFHAAAFTAPMIKIQLPISQKILKKILTLTEQVHALRVSYAVTTGPWKEINFQDNPFTHSQKRLIWDQNIYKQNPKIKIGGPTYHWINESIKGIEYLFTHAHTIQCPILILQAGDDRIVSDQAQKQFLQLVKQKSPLSKLIRLEGANHEILLEIDEIRAKALDEIFIFFDAHPPQARHSQED